MCTCTGSPNCRCTAIWMDTSYFRDSRSPSESATHSAPAGLDATCRRGAMCGPALRERGGPGARAKLLRRRYSQRNKGDEHDPLRDREGRFRLGRRQCMEERHLLKRLDDADEHIEIQGEQRGRDVDPAP